MIRKLRSCEYGLYSRKINPKTGKRGNLGTFKTHAAADRNGGSNLSRAVRGAVIVS